MAYMKDSTGKRLDALIVPGTTYYANFANKPNGAVPAKADTGQAMRVWDNGRNVSGMAVSGGLLTHGAASLDNGASYLEAQLDGIVQRIGCRAKYSPTNTGAKTSLINWAAPGIVARKVDTVPAGDIPFGSIHFTADQFGWNFTCWQGASNGPILAREVSATAYSADTDGFLTWELVRRGTTIYVRRPDGTYADPITDAQVNTNTSGFVCHELYEYSTALTPAGFGQIWAEVV